MIIQCPAVKPDEDGYDAECGETIHVDFFKDRGDLTCPPTFEAWVTKQEHCQCNLEDGINYELLLLKIEEGE